MSKPAENLREAREHLRALAKELTDCAETAKKHGFTLTARTPRSDGNLPFFWASLLASPEWGRYLAFLRDSTCHGWAEEMIVRPISLRNRSSAGQRECAKAELGRITGEYWKIPDLAIDALLKAAFAGIREERHLAYTLWAIDATMDQRHAAERKQLDRRQKREREAAARTPVPHAS